MAKKHSDDEIRQIAYDIYTSQDTDVQDYVTDHDLRATGRTPAEAYAEDLVDPAISGVDRDEWDEGDLKRLKEALRDLAEADMEPMV